MREEARSSYDRAGSGDPALSLQNRPWHFCVVRLLSNRALVIGTLSRERCRDGVREAIPGRRLSALASDDW